MSDRLSAYRYGIKAELFCMVYLVATGHRVLARRVRNPFGEIDLIARRGRALLFIEVKARRTLEEGLECVLPRQQQRILRAAQAWLARQRRYQGFDLRCDVIAVAGWRLKHVKNAFDASMMR